MIRKLVLSVTLTLFTGLCLFTVPEIRAEECSIEVPCKNAKDLGDYCFHVELNGDKAVFTVKYPVLIRELIGGFDKGGKSWSSNIEIYLDTDNNPKTGMEADEMFGPGQGGSEFMVGASEMETSVARDAKGEWINRPKLFADIKKLDESVDLPEGYYPEWQFGVDGEFTAANWVEPQKTDTMRLTMPLSILGVKPGDKIRVTAVTSLCRESFPYPAKAETVIKCK